MQAVGSFVLPKNGVYTTNCSSESFPAAVDPFINLLAARGDLDRAAATHRDRIETSARGFLESDATSCVDGAVCTTNGSITIEIEVEVGFKGSSSTRIGIDPARPLTRDQLLSLQVCRRLAALFFQRTVFTTNFCSSEFPSAVDPFINLLAARGDLIGLPPLTETA